MDENLENRFKNARLIKVGAFDEERQYFLSFCTQDRQLLRFATTFQYDDSGKEVGLNHLNTRNMARANPSAIIYLEVADGPNMGEKRGYQAKDIMCLVEDLKKKKIHFKPTKITWKSLKAQGHEIHSFYDYEKYMKDNMGFEEMEIAGGIGYSGEKIHIIRVIGKKVDDNTIEVASARSICGSAKWRSGTYLHSKDTDIVDCKHCIKEEKRIQEWKKEQEEKKVITPETKFYIQYHHLGGIDTIIEDLTLPDAISVALGYQDIIQCCSKSILIAWDEENTHYNSYLSQFALENPKLDINRWSTDKVLKLTRKIQKEEGTSYFIAGTGTTSRRFTGDNWYYKLKYQIAIPTDKLEEGYDFYEVYSRTELEKDLNRLKKEQVEILTVTVIAEEFKDGDITGKETKLGTIMLIPKDQRGYWKEKDEYEFGFYNEEITEVS